MTQPKAGHTFTHYRLIEKIGEGGMGVVWRAQDTVLGRSVAVKVLSADAARDDERRRMFLEEARLAASLSEAHIVQVYELVHEEDLDFIVMEYVEGRSLDLHLHGRPLAAEKVGSLGLQVAQALSRAHRKGLLHRDLKPANILVTRDGDVKLLDFGLAVLLEPQARSADELTHTPLEEVDEGEEISPAGPTRSGPRLAGTLPYMAPEQVRGHPLDTRTDIFSLGVVLYEMTTGRRPFVAEARSELLREILKGHPVPPHDLVPKLPLELDRIIQKALAPRPQDRYQTMQDLAVDLKHLCRDLEAGSSPSYEDLRQSLTPSRRRRARFWIGAALAVAGVLIVGVLGFRRWPLEGAGTIRSLAVLPFENLSPEAGEEYFADGMTEQLITELAQLSALRVISRSSVMRYKGARTPLSEVARALDVDAVVEGSVMRSGERVRITAQLIEAATDRHLWAQSYERDLRDVLGLQSELARTISREVRIQLTPEEQVRLLRARTVNPQAYELYLKGRHHWNKRTAAGMEKAVEYFQRAIDLDPTDALAYAGLADCYNLMTDYNGLPPGEAFPKAKAAAAMALEIDDARAEAHVSLAHSMAWYDWDFARAEEEYRRAIALNPSYATGHHWYGWLLVVLGRQEEALAEIRRGRELDPLSEVIRDNVGLFLYFGRQYDDAIRSLESGTNEYYLSLALEQKGELRRAAALLEGADVSNAGRLAALGHTYALLGERQKAQVAIDALEAASRDRYVSPCYKARVYAGLGDAEAVFGSLEEAFLNRDELLLWLRIDPRFDAFRSDRRYEDLVHRIGLQSSPAARPATPETRRAPDRSSTP